MAVSLGRLPSLSLVYDATTNATPELNVLSGPCKVHSIRIVNADGAARYLKLYDDLNPTVGTTAPHEILRVPASTNITFHFGKYPLEFSQGLSFASVTAGGTAGTTGSTDVTTSLACTEES